MSATSVNGVEISALTSFPGNEAHAGETIEDARLAEHGLQLATSHVLSGRRTDAANLVKRCQQSVRAVESAIREHSHGRRIDTVLDFASAWLKENGEGLLDELRDIREHFPKEFGQDLPKLESGPLRIYAVAMELTTHANNQIDASIIARFISAYQSLSPLTIREVWALPTMLRIALVENIRQIALHVFPAKDLKHLAGPSNVTSSMTDALHDHSSMQMAPWDSLTLAIHSLQAIDELDAAALFERINIAEAILRTDPARVYEWMDVPTRERYRQVVDDLALRTGTPDVEVARRAIEFADAADKNGDFRKRHVGYYLVDRGRDQLESLLHYVPRQNERLRRVVLQNATVAFLGTIGLLTLLAMFLAAAFAASAGGAIGVCLLAAILALLPASELATSLVNHWIPVWFTPHTLPKLEFKQGIPVSYPTMVVIPSLLTDEREVGSLLERLERHFLANPDPRLSFALLTDFVDAPAQEMPADKGLLARAAEGIRKLNERYRAVESLGGQSRGSSRDRFFLLHRERRWNSQDNVWMGWERKRGKLIEFNRLLLGSTDTSYTVKIGDVSRLPKIKFVITLDADTKLPHGAAVKLVGTLAHPLNRPQLTQTPSGHCVAEGYAMLQPRVAPSLSSANRSWYTWMYSQGAGLSPYITACSDVYQDLFHEGSFVGKGIYDVAAIEATLDDAFPENHILSHDLIEGCHARVALVTDIVLLDGFPTRYEADARRQHRWARGDWQLLPWLFSTVPSANGRRPNPLSLISKWKIADNLRRSLVPAAILVLLLAGWTVLPGSSLLWTIGALLVPTFPLLMEMTRLLSSRPPEVSWRDQFRSVAGYVLRTVVQTACAVIFLPHRAQLMIDGAARAVHRSYRSRQRMLEWECAADTERRMNGSRWTNLREMWFPPVLAVTLVILAASGVLKAGAFAEALPLIAAWLVSPLVAQWISSPIRVRRQSLTAEQRQWLWEIARKTWMFFQTYVVDEDHWMPPDNVHELPVPRIASRISPTNEGLFLVSALAACDLGFVTAEELATLLESNLDNWEQLERYRGHSFNWYDTQTMQPISPRYVSTVDSGNLAASLVTMDQGLQELAARQPESLRQRLSALAQRCGRLAQEMDFGFLFDRERRLFHIGLNVETERLDKAHYDLLASEARLASYFAIAKGDIDHRHWFQLGRSQTRVADRTCLLSWGGTMFEYLMPTLFTRTIPESLLDHACRAAVARQIEYGKQRRVPWGISESAFALLTTESEYGYQSFGVPGLGARRGLSNDLVVAPYASALALSVDAEAAARNLSSLARLGALGQYGFFDAVDYTHRRMSRGQNHAVVPCYMAHHQGMTLIALANVLRDDCMCRRFHSHPAIRAAELLLHEQVPEGIAPIVASEEDEDPAIEVDTATVELLSASDSDVVAVPEPAGTGNVENSGV